VQGHCEVRAFGFDHHPGQWSARVVYMYQYKTSRPRGAKRISLALDEPRPRAVEAKPHGSWATTATSTRARRPPPRSPPQGNALTELTFSWKVVCVLCGSGRGAVSGSREHFERRVVLSSPLELLGQICTICSTRCCAHVIIAMSLDPGDWHCPGCGNLNWRVFTSRPPPPALNCL
jgi:hypothetical protein